jgi:TrmH family RNA methyltransferase
MEERISSRKNPLLQQVKKLLSSRAERRKQGLFVADGTKLLEEAVKYCPGLETVILSEGVEALVPEHVRVVRVPADVMASISPMEAPQGALFLGRLPQQQTFVPTKGMLILDGIQDPGNVGTILRTADAMDVPVVLLEGCADPWSWKVIRSTMGAAFRVPVIQATWEEVLTACREAGIPIGVTALSDRAVDIRTAQVSDMALVIGSEGRGVRKEVLENADHELIIPMNPHCESLNAAIAAAIVMWQIRAQKP